MLANDDIERCGYFTLPEDFLEPYRRRAPRWGFGPLSWVTFKRTYSRGGEDWWQTCRRVIEGMFTFRKAGCLAGKIHWDPAHEEHLAREAYDRLWRFKWTPPGRGLWAMGTRHVYERGGAALNNCGFVSTRRLDTDFAAPFAWMFRMAMLGVGVGFDTRGAGRVGIGRPARFADTHAVGDSREGWAAALTRLLNAYTGRGALPARWDYSRVRPAGKPLRSFGGTAGGPGPLKRMIESVTALFDACRGKTVDARLIVDTMNLVGRCVVAGGIRHAAQIALGDPGDAQFLALKADEEKNAAYRWVANHSVLAETGMDYGPPAAHTRRNGEPGYLWLENARRYGRMADPPDRGDEPALGTNPCAEQTLWDHELCCLVETYPAHHADFADYRATLRIAYLYAKTVTMIATGEPRTDEVMANNRRMGCSMTGITQAVAKLGRRRFFSWCDRGFAYMKALDAHYAAELGIPASVKLTSVKPSGTVSLLAGATPGVHWDHAPCYLRRIRVPAGHPLEAMCRDAGYPVEADRRAENTVVIGFPVAVRHQRRRKADVPLREKLTLAADMQARWSDNQVSCTAAFDPETEADRIPALLAAFDRRLKTVSFLPAAAHGYPQPPYEEIDREEYERLVAGLKPIRGRPPHEHRPEAAFCEGGACETV